MTSAAIVGPLVSLWPHVSFETGWELSKHRGFPVILPRVLAFIVGDFKALGSEKAAGTNTLPLRVLLMTSRL